MYKIRSHIVALLCLWPLLVMAQSHDFEVRDFHENPTDLTAVSSNVKDLNGKTAALIRFAVRDTLFSFEANNGIIKQKKVVGEVLLFVPQGTKRITVRHPYLGILRDFQLPLFIESKTTYDAEIEITNVEYLRKLMGLERLPKVDKTPIVTKPEIQQEEEIVEKPVVDDEFLTQTPKQKKPHVPMDLHFLVGGGFNAFSVMGPNVSVGVQLGKIILSADYTIGLQKVEGVGIYSKVAGNSQKLTEAYDYSASRFSVRLGLGSPDASVQIAPLIGASFNMIRGKEIGNKLFGETQFSESNSISLSVALSLRIRLFDSLSLAVTPQYDFAVGADDVFKVIKSADSKVKAWGEGIGVHAGLLYHF